MYYVPEGVLALVADEKTSRSSFKFWLLTSLSTFHNNNRKCAGVYVFVFVPDSIPQALGEKRVNSILSEATQRNIHWVDEIQVMGCDQPVTEDMAKMFIEQFSKEAMISDELDYSGEVYFGYDSQEDIEKPPVCAVRKIDLASDVEKMREDSGLNYQVGDWYVIGEKGGAVIISEPFSDLDLALMQAQEKFGSIRFELIRDSSCDEEAQRT